MCCAVLAVLAVRYVLPVRYVLLLLAVVVGMWKSVLMSARERSEEVSRIFKAVDNRIYFWWW